MALNKEEILDSIANMSVMDVVELVEAMEEKFGVRLRLRQPLPRPRPRQPRRWKSRPNLMFT